VEWAKAKARADRWEEEVILLDEEMRRVLQFCRWKADWWVAQVPQRVIDDNDNLAAGLVAYASEQAYLEKHIHDTWEVKWSVARARAVPIILGFMLPWYVESDKTIEIEIEDEGYTSDYEDW
jgi:hypothetical protein